MQQINKATKQYNSQNRSYR